MQLFRDSREVDGSGRVGLLPPARTMPDICSPGSTASYVAEWSRYLLDTPASLDKTSLRWEWRMARAVPGIKCDRRSRKCWSLASCSQHAGCLLAGSTASYIQEWAPCLIKARVSLRDSAGAAAHGVYGPSDFLGGEREPNEGDVRYIKMALFDFDRTEYSLPDATMGPMSFHPKILEVKTVNPIGEDTFRAHPLHKAEQIRQVSWPSCESKSDSELNSESCSQFSGATRR